MLNSAPNSPHQENGLTPTFIPSLASSAHATAPHRQTLSHNWPPAKFSSTFILLSILSTPPFLPFLPKSVQNQPDISSSFHFTPLPRAFLFSPPYNLLVLLTATSVPELELEGLSVLLLCWVRYLVFYLSISDTVRQ